MDISPSRALSMPHNNPSHQRLNTAHIGSLRGVRFRTNRKLDFHSDSSSLSHYANAADEIPFALKSRDAEAQLEEDDTDRAGHFTDWVRSITKEKKRQFQLLDRR